jgi:nucleoside 2-deoxyribosyltransferase
MSKPRCYLAGGISGLPYAEVVARRRGLTEALEEAGYEVVDPMANEVNPQDEHGMAMYATVKGGREVTPAQVALMDLEQVDSCDVIFFDFDFYPDSVSRGAFCEMAYSYGKKPIYCWVARQSVYDYPFVWAMASVWSYNLSEVLEEMQHALHS